MVSFVLYYPELEVTLPFFHLLGAILAAFAGGVIVDRLNKPGTLESVTLSVLSAVTSMVVFREANLGFEGMPKAILGVALWVVGFALGVFISLMRRTPNDRPTNQ